MEINDMIRLMQAVSKNGLTSFQFKENDMTLTIVKKEPKVQQLAALAGNAAAPHLQQQAVTGGAALGGAAGVMSFPGGPGGGISEAMLGSRLTGVQPGAQETETQLPGAGAAAGQLGAGAYIASDKIVVSPLVGTFYHSATPDSEPYVKVGDSVKKGQTLGIIEAMKLMNEIECEFDGVVDAVLVENENVVEYGQPLFRIR